jgi:hypothetical protein
MPVSLGTHARIGQDLRDCVLRGGRLLALVGAAQRLDVVAGVIVGNKLQCIRDALHQVLAADDGHFENTAGRVAGRMQSSIPLIPYRYLRKRHVSPLAKNHRKRIA